MFASSAAAAADDDEDDHGDDGVMIVATVMTTIFGLVRVGCGDFIDAVPPQISWKSMPRQEASWYRAGFLGGNAQMGLGASFPPISVPCLRNVRAFLDAQIKLDIFEYLWWIGLVPYGEEWRQSRLSSAGWDSKTPHV